ncbi:MAG: hypothetical protein WAP37_04395 [Solirubrobacterales bacterium]
MKKHLRAPSPSMAISLLALFVALSGTAVAASSLAKNSVTTKSIRKNAVTGPKIKTGAVASSDVKNNSLNGNDINESALGTVPSATNAATATNAASATNATNATNAGSVNGSQVVKVNYRGESGGPAQAFFNAGGLTLTGTCAAGLLAVTATTSVEDALIHAGVHSFINSATANDGTKSTYDEDDNFDVGNSFNLLAGTAVIAGDIRDSTQGALTYTTPGGAVVTINYTTEEDANGLGGNADCFFIGNAVVS